MPPRPLYGFLASTVWVVASLASCSPPLTPVLSSLPAEQTVVSPAPASLLDPPLVVRPFAEVEAEACASSGTWSAPSTSLFSAGAEASGRRYVSLAPGQRLSLPAPVAGDSLVVRFSLPNSASGLPQDGTLTILVGSQPALSLTVSSRYSHEYGIPTWGSTNVWNQAASQGRPRHHWDEANLRTPAYAVGTPIVVANPVTARESVLIDLLDFELVPPAPAVPAGSHLLKTDNTGTTDVTDEVQALANLGGVVYIPEGTYRIRSVSLGNVTIQGAGLWRTRFVGPASQFRFAGGQARLADFALFGETSTRNDLSDAENGLAGVPASGSTIERLWIEHKKCAYWVGTWNNGVGPTGLTIAQCRFRNTMADAVNLCSGTTNTVVQDCLVRGTGDDALAAWSPTAGGPTGGGNSFLRNLIQSPWVANGIALYGGGGFVVEGNEVRDTVTTGSGIYVSATFGSWPFTGATTVKNNLLIRAGAHESDWGGPTGALRVLSGEKVMTGGSFEFLDNTVVAPLESAVSIQGPFDVGALTFTGLTATNLGGAAVVDVRSNAKGSAAFSLVSLPETAVPVWRNSAPMTFTLTHP